MIEINTFGQWVETMHFIEIHNVNFERSDLRIDGVVYTEDTEEFRDAFKKAKLWAKLIYPHGPHGHD